MSEQRNIEEENNKKSSENLQKSDNDDIHIVEKILNKRIQETGPEYRVKWLGYPNSANMWVPAADLDCPELIEEYMAKKRKKKPDGKVQIATEVHNAGDQKTETATEEVVDNEPSKIKKRSTQSAKPGLSTSQPPPKKSKAISAAKKNDETNAFYEVDSILGKRLKDGDAQYKVKWKTFSEPTWEPASNLQYCDLLDRYEEELRMKQVSKRVSHAKSTAVAEEPSVASPLVSRLGILKKLPVRRLSEGTTFYQPHATSGDVHEQGSPTARSDTEIFGQLVVRKLNNMDPIDVGQAQVEILQIINRVKFRDPK